MSSMRDVILNQHEQITRSLQVNKDVHIDGEFDSIVLAGMGGSGHPGDLVNALGITTRPLYVHRNYDVPLHYMGTMGFSSTLLVASSYSGNTEESLTAYRQAQEHNIPVIASASGGTLKEWAERDGVPFCKIDFTGMQPRHTLFAAFTGIYAALRNSGLANDIDADLNRVATVLDQKTAELESAGTDLADAMKDKVPVYYSSDSLGFATKNFKIQTNENAKYPAFWSTLPEANHNELLGFSKLKESGNPNDFFVLFIRDEEDHPRVKARMDVTRDLYREWGVTVAEHTISGETVLEKIFLTTTLGLWTTMLLAEAVGVDPVPVEGVENLKAKLKEVAGDITN